MRGRLEARWRVFLQRRWKDQIHPRKMGLVPSTLLHTNTLTVQTRTSRRSESSIVFWKKVMMQLVDITTCLRSFTHFVIKIETLVGLKPRKEAREAVFVTNAPRNNTLFGPAWLILRGMLGLSRGISSIEWHSSLYHLKLMNHHRMWLVCA